MSTDSSRFAFAYCMADTCTEAAKARPDDAQRAFMAALVELAAAEAKVRQLSWRLPALTGETVANALTSWRNSVPAQIVEGGYMRWTDLETADDGEEWYATTDGWDDMSDEGAYQFVEVDGLPYAMPDDVDYD